MARIPKNRTINIPAWLWERLDDMWMANYGAHVTKAEIQKILEDATKW